MRSGFRRCPVPWLPLGLTLTFAFATSGAAQAPPDPSPFSQNSPPLPSTSPQPPPPSVAAAPAAAASTADYEARIQQLEAIVRQMQAQQAAGVVGAGATPTGGGPSTAPPDPGTAVGRTGAPAGLPGAGTSTPSATGGSSAPGQSLPPNPPASNRFDSPATLASVKANVKFGPGFEIRTEDDEFILQFHNLTQFDYRGYQQGGQNTVHDTFAVPRQWFMFSGRITKPVGYFVSLQNSFDTISPLDYFIDLSYDPRLQVRMGRMKTPFTYEFLVEPIQGLQLPERSVFFNNFAQNRDVGAMAYGRVLDKTVDYAVGVYNGTRNGFVANHDSKAVSAFVNWKPFGNAEGTVLENFNVGGSVFSVNNSNNITIPQTLRTAVPTAGNPVLGVPFLTFNNNVRENGNDTFYDVHAAWFYKQLAVLGEYGFGNKDYSLTSSPNMRTRLPVNSFYVQGGYLLTGETRSSLGIVKPLHPFDLRKGKRGPGAWEVVGRYQYMDIGNQVFTNGLADANNGANRLFITELGFNWHMTQYLKFYFDWEHSEFNQSVLYAPGRRQLTSDMFFVRMQLYF